MKILLFLHSLSAGGAERVAANLATHWSNQGISVCVVTLATTNTDFYVLPAQIQRISMSMAEPSAGVLSALAANARRATVLRRLIRKLRPDFVISFMTTANVILALASMGLGGVCCIGSEHTHPPQRPLGPIWETLRRYLYGRLFAVVALTADTRVWLLRHTTASNVPVIPNPVPWPFTVQAPIVAPNSVCRAGRKILLAVGRLDPVKQFGVLVRAFGELARTHSQWDLVIVGDGSELQNLQQQVSAFGISDRVHFPGRVGNVGAWYEAADVYVLTSAREGFPNTLAEALAHKLPSVCFDCDTGPRDILSHEIDGFLVPPGDEQELVRSLSRLMESSDLRGRFAGNASAVRDRLSMRRIDEMWQRLFRSAKP